MTTIPPNPLDTDYMTPKPEQTGAKKSDNAALGKDDFLKLFVAQLQHQDPMNPMQDSDFMGQMASFSTLEQVSNLAMANEKIASNLTSSNAIGLIGRTVTWTEGTGDDATTHSGVVESVSTKDGKPSLTVSGTEGVDPSTIQQVA
jgi:flagellar basal-body rod modification protein FlgD